MKNITLRVLSIMMAVIIFANTLVGCGTGTGNMVLPVSSLNQHLDAGQVSLLPIEKGIEQNAINQKRIETWVSEVEQSRSLQLTPNGTLCLKPINTRATALSIEAEQFAEKALEGTNARVREGLLTIHSDLSIHPVNEAITRANQTYVKFYWWGVRLAVSHQTWLAFKDAWQRLGLTGIISQLAKIGLSGSWAASAVAPLIVTLILLLDWVDRHGGNKGFYLDITWALLWVAYPQT